MTRSFAGKCSVSIIFMAVRGAGMPATAFPQATNNRSDRSLTWAFSQDPQLAADKKSWVRDGIRPWTDPPTQDAYDFQIRFFGTAVQDSTGAYGQVQLDNVRGE